MLQCLISGNLTKPPARRTSQGGTEYVTACILANAGRDESYIVNAVAFADAACDALMSLQVGESVSIAGMFKPSGWVKEGGEVGVSVSVVANAVLTIADANAPGRSGPASPERQAPRPSNHRKPVLSPAPPPSEYFPFDDKMPF